MREHGSSHGAGAARSVLTFEPAVVTWPEGVGRRSRERETHFLDPVVDGVTLRSRVVDHGVVGALRSDLADLAGTTASELLGLRAAASLEAGRVELLVCQVCADLGCGSLTVALDVGDDDVVWSAPLWSTGDEATPDDLLCGTTFRFERTAYEAAVRAAVRAVADLPTWSPPRPHRWPWPAR